MCKIPIISEGLALFVSLVLQAQSVLFKAMYNVFLNLQFEFIGQNATAVYFMKI